MAELRSSGVKSIEEQLKPRFKDSDAIGVVTNFVDFAMSLLRSASLFDERKI